VTCDTHEESYNRTCGYCNYQPPYTSCAKITCSFAEADPDGEAQVDDRVSLGENVVIKCKPGFRASRNPAVAVNVTSPSTYQSRCTDTCAPMSAWSCQPLTCTPPTVKNATAGDAVTVSHNGQVDYQCDAGYKLEGSTEGAPCVATFTGECRDGVIFFSALTNGESTTPPKCVPIRGCSPNNDDVCGSEGCGAVPVSEFGEENGVPSAESARDATDITITCNQGYAAVAPSADATCDGATEYTVSCTTCR
jgi:hypothetical protein